ncbi:hypothetical protein [Dyella silvatica]|uniref:hypothetical protein n=1 Tax=Dyella silvatica TaxID=2992128 RepID=UPI00224EC780|nr:hypothetical protein [Dyella silvatica]
MNIPHASRRQRAIALFRWMLFALAMGPHTLSWAHPSAAERAAGKTSAAGVDALACAEDTTASAAKALHFAGAADFWREGRNAACRLDPVHSDRAIVALTYVHGEEITGQPQQGYAAEERDLDLLVIDLGDGQIIAHRHEDAAIEDDGERFEGMAIDTGRYVLAKGQRAFGVRTINASHCRCINNRVESLTLYLQHGSRLDRILSTHASEWQASYETGSEPPPTCAESATTLTTTVMVGAGNSHGLADLRLATTATSSDVDDDASATKCPALAPGKKIVTLHFDGQSYK